MPGLGPAVEDEAFERLGPAEADAFLARLETLSFDITEPLGVSSTATWRTWTKLATQLVLDALRAAAARPPELRRLDRRREIDPAWFQRSRMIGYVCYADRFAGSLRGSARAPGLPGRAGRHLPAPDAAAAAARGGERRRLRGGRLRPGGSAGRHHGRPAGAGRRPARARHRAVRGPGAQPHRAGARMGPQGGWPASPATARCTWSTRTAPNPTPTSAPCPRCSPTSRRAASPRSRAWAGCGRASTSTSGT